ncbi:cardiolipin synthase [Rhizosphaericola mali]|uniref:Cardiolipin synthase n=1 Tax=Rhizosphaericola mali TaxID=2545455 RepID=A0A5P2G868_9BACT|nr:cardiolipin synthase [Rhizosphaericola mali]QES89950.1 cardiolipin synthase [Rhizosphaericola mali]
MDSLLFLEYLYVPIIIGFCIHIVLNTKNTSKTLAYLLLVIFLPLLGIIIYLLLGINQRKNKLYSRKLLADQDIDKSITDYFHSLNTAAFLSQNESLLRQEKTARFVAKDSFSPVLLHNDVKILNNGELTFPEIFHSIEKAKSHIHIEFYIIENDQTGKQLKELLIKKAQQGIQVRIIYDDFGSMGIRNEYAEELRKYGVEIYPFMKLKFVQFANRVNYRNHRKIVIVDGITSFVGGLNISDRYRNDLNSKQHSYWRDTHIRIDGLATYSLQNIFLCDWNFAANQYLTPNEDFFPQIKEKSKFNKTIQIVSSGPDSENPTIMFALMQAIASAQEEVLITTPYFIPSSSVLNILKISAISGVKIKILVPFHSDSKIVGAATSAYFDDLLDVGIEIYQYKKGFIHSKTMVCDREIAIIGTANMDIRSFDLNFEVNAHIYNPTIAQELAANFYDDINNADKINPAIWKERSVSEKLISNIAKLSSSLL